MTLFGFCPTECSLIIVLKERVYNMIEKKNNHGLKSWMISIGLITIVLPIIFNYPLSLKFGQIAMGITIISNEFIENKLIKRIIAVIAIAVILYSYFKFTLLIH